MYNLLSLSFQPLTPKIYEILKCFLFIKFACDSYTVVVEIKLKLKFFVAKFGYYKSDIFIKLLKSYIILWVTPKNYTIFNITQNVI